MGGLTFDSVLGRGDHASCTAGGSPCDVYGGKEYLKLIDELVNKYHSKKLFDLLAGSISSYCHGFMYELNVLKYIQCNCDPKMIILRKFTCFQYHSFNVKTQKLEEN